MLYVVSRVMASFIPRATSPYNTSPESALASSVVKPIPPDSRYFTLFAALSWGAVMWLFQHRGETIQPGMFNSMKYLYRDSEAWNNLRTLFWHNTWELALRLLPLYLKATTYRDTLWPSFRSINDRQLIQSLDYSIGFVLVNSKTTVRLRH